MGLGNSPFKSKINQDHHDTIIPLTEDSGILELLFQFCYPDRHPDLKDLEFTALTKFAAAVEKYNVFSAILICKIRMRYRHFVTSFYIIILWQRKASTTGSRGFLICGQTRPS
jgi:hypothetical protein